MYINKFEEITFLHNLSSGTILPSNSEDTRKKKEVRKKLNQFNILRKYMKPL